MNAVTPEPRCWGVLVDVFDGAKVNTTMLRCLGHDGLGNHLVREPHTGRLRWIEAGQ